MNALANSQVGELRVCQDLRPRGPCVVYVERNRRIERVAGRLFEGEEALIHVMGAWVAASNRRYP